jgi:hypothetical protein
MIEKKYLIIFRCLPRWSVIQGFMFSTAIDGSLRPPLSDYEFTPLTSADLVIQHLFLKNYVSGV